MANPVPPSPPPSPDLWSSISEEEALRIGAAVSELQTLRGWGVLVDQLRTFEYEAAVYGLRDVEKPRDYWIGFQDCARKLLANLDSLKNQAKAIQDENRARGVMNAPLRSIVGNAGDSLSEE